MSVLKKLPRLTSWWLIALALSLAVFIIAPQQLPVTIYKMSLISLAAVAGYWIDRSVFHYARPNTDALRVLDQLNAEHPASLRALDKPGDGQPARFTDEVAQGGETCMLVSMPDATPVHFMLGCMLRRAIIIAAAILAVSLGA